MKSDKDVFMSVKELGNLYLYDVLLEYIYPRVFVCEDVFESKYLFYEMSNLDNTDVWLVSKITKDEYYSLVDRKISLQSAYKKKSKYNLFSISKIYSDKEDIIEMSHEITKWLKKLPQDPVLAEKDPLDKNELEILSVARESKATTFEIRFYSGTDRHFIPHKTMSELCDSITALTASIYGNNRKDSLRVSTAPGSCIVRFSFMDQINLFNETDAEKELKIINNVLKSERVLDELDSVKDKEKFIKSYSKMLYAIRRTNSDVLISTAMPNSTIVHKVDLTSIKVEERYKTLKNIKVESKSETVKGTLIALDIKSKRFKFEEINGSIISGVVTDEFLDNGSYKIPNTYKAHFTIEKYLNFSTINEYKYYLQSLMDI